MAHHPTPRRAHRPRRAVAAAGAAAVVGVAALAAAATTLTARAAEPPGIHVADDGRILEADGTDLVLRGVNHAHAWYAATTPQALADIKDTGANSVRVVLATGDRWTRTDADAVADIVDECTQQRLVCVLEPHDTTGWGEEPAAASLDQAVDYWEYLLPVLEGTEDRVMINIGNEPFGNDDAANELWDDHTKAAIQRLRDIGYEHALVVDAPNWGQDWKGLMNDQAEDVAAADPQGDTVFSIHLYGVYSDPASITAYLERFVDADLPIIVGEFGHSGTGPDEDVVLAEAERLGLGWLAWSWSGNTDPVLDLVYDFDPTTPSTWGTRIIAGPDGLAETGVEASVFGGTDPTPDPTPTDEPTEEPTPDPTPTDEPTDGACTAELSVQNSWPGGFQGQVTVTAGDAAIDGWSTSWTLPSGTTVAQLWSGALSVDGSAVTVANAAWNGALGAGTSASYGFIGSGPAPSDADVACAAG
ncbi:cellulase family glycosylhydrolase [Isoptericola aurantiacus]|uniref:cellulase family glycosylhydrolase n=1 Tax=Isoptericola aurantiacus TaxID=3377839 RepID=UPI00383A3C23